MYEKKLNMVTTHREQALKIHLLFHYKWWLDIFKVLSVPSDIHNEYSGTKHTISLSFDMSDWNSGSYKAH